MTLRNAVKATLLSLEDETPRASAAKPAPVFDVSDAIAPPLSVVEGSAPVPAKPTSADWRARAEGLDAMTDTLPSPGTRTLMPNIAKLYQELAAEAGPPETDTPAAPDDAVPEAPPQVAAPVPAAPAVFPRRSLPSPRHRFIRR